MNAKPVKFPGAFETHRGTSKEQLSWRDLERFVQWSLAQRRTKIHGGIQTGADRAPTTKATTSLSVHTYKHLLSKISRLTSHTSSSGRSTLTQLSFLPCPCAGLKKHRHARQHSMKTKKKTAGGVPRYPKRAQTSNAHPSFASTSLTVLTSNPRNASGITRPPESSGFCAASPVDGGSSASASAQSSSSSRLVEYAATTPGTLTCRETDACPPYAS